MSSTCIVTTALSVVEVLVVVVMEVGATKECCLSLKNISIKFEYLKSNISKISDSSWSISTKSGKINKTTPQKLTQHLQEY